MKYLKSTVLVLLLLGFTSVSNAQRGAMQGRAGIQQGDMRIPDLTDEQREQIQQLRLEHREAVLPLQNELREKQARLQTLTTGEETDLAAANQVIEEIGALRTEMMKTRLEHRMSVRNLLTEEQRIVFDTARGPGRGFRGMGNKPRMRRGGPRGG